MDIKVIGTAGIILKAGLDGKLDVKETIEELDAIGFRLSKEVKDHLLEENR